MDFFYRHKTKIFLVLFLVFSLLIALILYSLFARTNETLTQPGQSGTGGFPSADDGKGQIVESGEKSPLPESDRQDLIPQRGPDEIADGSLTKTEMLSALPGSQYTGSADGQGVQFYNEADGKFYKIDENGQLITLSDRVFYNVKDVDWSNKKDKAVIEYPDGSNIVYDFENEKSVTLPKHWEEFSFAPDDKQIAAKSIGLDPGNRWLMIANSDGSNAIKVEALGENGDRVDTSWSPNNQTVAMFTESIDADRQNLFFVGKNQENFKSTIIEGRDFRPLWSPDGKILVYSVYSTKNDLKPMLWAVAAQGDNIGQGRQSLGLETWSDKCSFHGASLLFCAVPKTLEEGSGLFPDIAKQTDDYLYRIDLKNGTKELIAIPEKEMTIGSIVISADGKTAFVSDSNTRVTYKIKL